MSMLLDRRDERHRKPGLHAFLVGVSNYPFLPEKEYELEKHHYGLMRLSATSLAVFNIAQWLLENKDRLAVPLTTCRLLLSPTITERERINKIRRIDFASATLETFKDYASEWRQDAFLNRDNVMLFYFAGHGAQPEDRDHLMLLQNFGNEKRTIFCDAVDTLNLINGMGPEDGENIAQHQIYFIDACRTRHKDFATAKKTATSVWDTDTYLAPRVAPIFFATRPGRKAHEIPDQETIFSRALIDCLNGNAAVQLPNDTRWCITLNSLQVHLRRQIDELNRQYNAEQDFTIDNGGTDLVVLDLQEPPSAEVGIELRPVEGGRFADIFVRHNGQECVWRIRRPISVPTSKVLPAGRYLVEALVEPPAQPYVNFCNILEATAPRTNWSIRILPG
jgi:Caspase domain